MGDRCWKAYLVLALGTLFTLTGKCHGAAEYAFVSDTVKRTVFQVDLSNVSYANVHHSYSTSRYLPTVLACDTIGRDLYWVDNKNMKIQRMPYNDSNSRPSWVLNFDFMNSMGGLSLDVNARLGFFADTTKKKIGVLGIKGGNQYFSTIMDTGLTKPTGVTVDPKNRVLYWSDPAEQSIYSSYYDGSNKQKVVSGNLNGTKAIYFDQIGRLLYWCDSISHKIERFDVASKDRQTVIDYPTLNQTIKSCAQLTVDAKFVYYVSEETNHIMYVEKANVTNMGSLDDVNSFERLGGLAFCDDALRFKGPTQCDANNGGCQFICLPVGQTDVKCKCSSGKVLLDDMKNCTVERYSHGESVMYNTIYSSYTRINGIEDHPDKWFDAPYIPRPYYKYVQDMELYDMDLYFAKKSVIAFDQNGKRLVRISVDGHNTIETIYAGTSNEVHGIAVDWINGNVYWTDMAYNHIMMAKIEPNTKTYKTIVEQKLEKPFGIAVHPGDGYLFWADDIDDQDVYKTRKIERSNLDGSDRQVIVSSKLYGPQAMTLDYDNKRVCFTNDARVECCNFTGGERTTIVSLNNRGVHFTGLTYYKGHMYIADYRSEVWYTPRIIFWRIRDRYGFYMSTYYKTHGVTMYAKDRQPDFPKVCENSGCQHLCTRGGNGAAKCLCADGYNINPDGKTCKVITTVEGPLYAITYGNRLVLMSSKSTLSSEFTLKEYPSATTNWTRIVANYHQGALFMLNKATNQIDSVKINDLATVHTVLYELNNVTDIAIDWVRNNLYWVDGTAGQIMISKLDGTHQMELRSSPTNEFTSIAVDPLDKNLYYAVRGTGIYMSGLDGKKAKLIRSADTPIISMIVDYQDRRLYSINTATGYVNHMPLNPFASNVRPRSFRLPYSSIALSVYQDFTTLIGRNVTNGPVWVLKTDLEGLTLIKPARMPINTTVGYDITTYASINQPLVSNATCPLAYADGGCEQHCFPAANGARACACTDDLRLGPDRRTCLASADLQKKNFLLVTDNRRGIYQIGDDEKVRKIKTPALELPSKAAFDVNTGMTYWTDGTTIKSMMMNDSTTTKTIKLDRDAKYTDLAFDSNSQLLYVVDNAQEKVKVFSANGLVEKTILSKTTGFTKPRCIALHPPSKSMYICIDGKIVKAAMNGALMQDVVSVEMPTSIVLDIASARRKRRDVNGQDNIYFLDGDTKQLSKMGLSTQNSDIVLMAQFEDDAQPSGLTLKDNSLYVTDTTSRGIVKIDKNSKVRENLNANTLSGLDGIVFVPPKPSGTVNPCSNHNGGCSHLCIPTYDPQVSAQRECACADGVRLGANGNCEGTTLCTNAIPRGYLDFSCARKPTEVCDFGCEPEHSTDVQTITCQDNGDWKPSLQSLCKPWCKKLAVNDSSVVFSGACSRQNRPPGVSCMMSCRVGFQVYGGDTARRCTFDAATQTSSWSGVPLVCGAITTTTTVPTTTTTIPTTTTTTPTTTTTIPTTTTTTPTTTTTTPTTTTTRPTTTTTTTVPTTTTTTTQAPPPGPTTTAWVWSKKSTLNPFIDPKTGKQRAGEQKGMSDGAIAGLIIGLVALILLVIAGIFLYKKYYPIYRSKRYEEHRTLDESSAYGVNETLPNVVYQSNTPDHLSFENPVYDSIRGAQGGNGNLTTSFNMTPMPAKAANPEVHFGPDMTGLPAKESVANGKDATLPPIESPRIEINTSLRGEQTPNGVNDSNA